MDADYFELMVIAAGFIAAASLLWFTLKTGISPMPSSAKARAAMLEASSMADDGVILECGSGWAGLLFALARKYPDRQVIGYELSWLPWLYSVIAKRLLGLSNVEIHCADFLKADLTDVSLICCYLYPGGMQQLSDKLTEEPQSGTMLISNTFALPGHEPALSLQLNELYRGAILIYEL